MFPHLTVLPTLHPKLLYHLKKCEVYMCVCESVCGVHVCEFVFVCSCVAVCK